MIETKCKSCYGCNRLKLADFKEVYRCENYMRGDTDERGTKENNSRNE